jgi:hypothetical protein
MLARNLTDAIRPVTSDATSLELGSHRVGIVQYDNRYCLPAADNSSNTTELLGPNATQRCGVKVETSGSATDNYWWISAAINAAWARTHGYDHLLYCASNCYHPDSGEKRSPQWCKVIAIALALQRVPRYAHVLFLDSDAYWKNHQDSISHGMIRRFALDWNTEHAAMYFASNSPWDSCGLEWNFRAPNAALGSACTAIILMQNTPSTLGLLRQWWHARNGLAGRYAKRRPGQCSDQATLWKMWADRPDLAQEMRILGTKPPPNSASPKSSSRTRWTMNAAGYTATLQKHSPVRHVTSVSPSRRRKTFSDAWMKHSNIHDEGWCVKQVHFDAAAESSRLFGHVLSPPRPVGPWFKNSPASEAEAARQTHNTAARQLHSPAARQTHSKRHTKEAAPTRNLE